MDDKPTVTTIGPLDMQVCVPTAWTDKEVKEFADREHLCGATHGWKIRRTGDTALRGAPERIPCSGRSAEKGFLMPYIRSSRSLPWTIYDWSMATFLVGIVAGSLAYFIWAVWD